MSRKGDRQNGLCGTCERWFRVRKTDGKIPQHFGPYGVASGACAGGGEFPITQATIEPLEVVDAFGDRMHIRRLVPNVHNAHSRVPGGILMGRMGDQYVFTRENAVRIRDWLTEYLREESEGS